MSDEETAPLYSLWGGEESSPTPSEPIPGAGGVQPLESLWGDDPTAGRSEAPVDGFQDLYPPSFTPPQADWPDDAAVGEYAAEAQSPPAQEQPYPWLRDNGRILTGRSVQELRTEIQANLSRLRELAQDGVPPVVVTPDVAEYMK